MSAPGVKGAGETLGGATSAAGDLAKGVTDAAGTVARLPLSNIVPGIGALRRCAERRAGLRRRERRAVQDERLCSAATRSTSRRRASVPPQMWLRGASADPTRVRERVLRLARDLPVGTAHGPVRRRNATDAGVTPASSAGSRDRAPCRQPRFARLPALPRPTDARSSARSRPQASGSVRRSRSRDSGS